jgi:hypothetical protein
MQKLRQFQPRIRSWRIKEEYDFIFDDKTYDVSRLRRDLDSWKSDGCWDYTIHSVSIRERRYCDPDKATHKRVLRAFLEVLREKDGSY